jgi:hypothetical protein
VVLLCMVVELCAGAAIVRVDWVELAIRAASRACASWWVKSAQAKMVPISEVTTTEAWALLALRAAALERRTFFLIAGSGFFANLEAIVSLPQGLSM